MIITSDPSDSYLTIMQHVIHRTEAASLILPSGYLAHLSQTIEMRENILDMHHVRLFVMQVEEIDLVGQLGAVEGAFFDD